MNLNIIPKVGENPNELDIIKDYLEDKLEIQLISNDFTKYTNIVKSFLEKHPFKIFIVHLPLCYSDWEAILMNKEIEEQFKKFVCGCQELSLKFNVHIYILGHLTLRYEIIEKTNLKEWFGFLMRQLQDYNVSFLIENPTSDPYKAKSGEPFFKFVKNFNNEKVRCCFDLCHYNVGKILYKDAYKMPQDLGEYVYSVHFSDFPIKENIFEPKTHGRGHKSKEDILKDLKVLEDLGIDLSKTYIVTEINEDDYENKPDLLRELQYLKEIKEDI